MNGNLLVINIFLYGFLAAILWFVYVVFIKNKLLKAKGLGGKLAYIMKKDASSRCARCTFYAFHDYENGYSQREWMEFCKQRTNNGTIDEKSEGFAEAVAPIINAIVVEDDMYIRRGLEMLAHSGVFFIPGETDELSLNYFVEPYEYVKSEVRKTSSTKARTTTVSHNSSSDRLTLAEKREIARAQHNYDYAVRMATANPDSKISANAEKQAHAEYMRVLAKYAGKK